MGTSHQCSHFRHVNVYVKLLRNAKSSRKLTSNQTESGIHINTNKQTPIHILQQTRYRQKKNYPQRAHNRHCLCPSHQKQVKGGSGTCHASLARRALSHDWGVGWIATLLLRASWTSAQTIDAASKQLVCQQTHRIKTSRFIPSLNTFRLTLLLGY
jgi:hypothetical protein